MSNAKTWQNPVEERKETRSLYLAEKDWEYLAKIGGKPGAGIRKLIEEKREQEMASNAPK